MQRVWLLVVILCAACVQKPPHATLTIDQSLAPKSHAVLVLPTNCHVTGYGTGGWHSALCEPSTFASGPGLRDPVPTTFGGYIDPPLRLKLEFAGFTLAEAAAMRVVTADRVDEDGRSRQIQGAGPQTVAELGIEDIRTVATSLGLTSILVPRLTFSPATIGLQLATLEIALLEVASMRARWTVKCSEELFEAAETMSRLANCVGNGVLAVLAPENVIGKAL